MTRVTIPCWRSGPQFSEDWWSCPKTGKELPLCGSRVRLHLPQGAKGNICWSALRHCQEGPGTHPGLQALQDLTWGAPLGGANSWAGTGRPCLHTLGHSPPVLVIAKNRPQLGPPHLVFAEDLPCQVVEGMYV